MVAERQRVIVVPKSVIDIASRDPSARSGVFDRSACFTCPSVMLSFLDEFDPHSAKQVRETPDVAPLIDRRAQRLGIFGYTLGIPAYQRLLQGPYEVVEVGNLLLAKGTLMGDMENRTRRTGVVHGGV